jgi:lipid A 3-O-deacylase
LWTTPWALLLLLAPALAQDNGPLGLSEIRGSINVTGVELWTGFRPYPGLEKYVSFDTLEVQLLFTPPDDTLLSYLGNPDISVGVHASTLGRASFVHLGLNWSAQLFETPFFIDGTVGAALTNSTLAGATPPDRNVGCPALLYFAADLGYRLNDEWSVMGTVYHSSHSSLCWLANPGAPNEGLNGYGVKIGYSF